VLLLTAGIITGKFNDWRSPDSKNYLLFLVIGFINQPVSPIATTLSQNGK